MSQEVQGMLIQIEATTAQLRREMAAADGVVASSTKKIDSQLAKVDGAFDRLNKQSLSALSDIRGNFDLLAVSVRAATAAIGAVGVGASLSRFIANTKAAEQEQAQLNAVLRSTGEAAGFSASQLNAMAQRVVDYAGVAGGAVTTAQTSLLAFTGVVGNEFVRALDSAANMSARTGMSLTQTAELIGRALDVPSQGMASLSRQGFRFSEDQKALMKQLEATGKTAEAQGIILNALEESYGGAASAARNTMVGALAALTNTFDDLLTGSETALSSVVTAINAINAALASPEAAVAISALGDALLAVSAIMAGRLVASAASAAGAFVIAQVEALRYQAALASMAGVSRTAAVAMTATATAARLATGAMALLGGPVGMVAAAAASFLLFRDSADVAKSSISALARHAEFEGAAIRNAIRDIVPKDLSTRSYSQITDQLSQLKTELNAAEGELDRFQKSVDQGDINATWLDKPKQKVDVLKGAVVQLEQELTGARLSSDKAGESYVKDLDRRLAMVGQETEVQKLRTSLEKGYLKLDEKATEQAYAKAAAMDKANEAAKAANQLTKDGAKDTAAAAKALADFVGQSQLSVTSTKALSAAYLTSAEAVSKATRQQKIEAEVLKVGEKNRAQVTKRINEMEDALEAFDISKMTGEMSRQNVELGKYAKALMLGGTATKEGRIALADYNDQREIEAAKVGKTAKEIDDLLPKLREEQRIRREGTDRNSALEQLNDLVVSTRTSHEKANDEIERMRELYALAGTESPAHLEAIRRRIVEIERETNVWAEFTQGAVDRVDGAFAEAWSNVFDGSNSLWDGLKKGFKQTLAEMAHMALTKPIIVSFASSVFGTSSRGGIGDVWGSMLSGGSSGGGGGGSSYGGALSNASTAYGIYQGTQGEGLLGALWKGYSNNGVTGAWNGATGYYGGVLQGINQSLGQIYGTITNGAGMTYAPISYQLGNTAAGSAASTAGGALSSLATYAPYIMAAWQGYQTHGVKGAAVQGGLAYAGGTAGAAVGAAAAGAMSGTTFGATYGSYFGPIGTVVGAIIGTLLGGAILGGGDNYKRQVGSATGVFTKGEYTGTGAVENWFGGSRRFGDDFDSSLHDLNEKFASSLGGLFEMFDVDSDIMTSSSARLRRTSGRMAAEFHAEFEGQLVTVMGQYGRKGNVDAALQQMFDDVLGRGLSEAIGKSSLPQYLKELTAGMTTAQQVSTSIVDLFQRFDGTNAVLGSISVSALDLNDKGLRAADALLNLTAAVAGLEDPTSAEKVTSLSNLTTAFYAGFVPKSQAFVDTMTRLRGEFVALDRTLPGTRKGFADLRSSFDLLTEEGRQGLVRYLQLSEAMDGYYTSMEELEAGYLSSFGTAGEQRAKVTADLLAEFSRLGVAMPVAKDGFRALIGGIDDTTTAGQDLRAQLLAMAPAMGQYLSGLESQRKALEDARLSASDSVAGNIGNLRSQIYLDQLGSDGAKYDYFKSQADALAKILPTLTNIDAIQSVSNQITALMGQTYGLLDESGKRQQGNQYVIELDKLQTQTHEQIIKSQEEASEYQAAAFEKMVGRATDGMVKELEKTFGQNASSQKQLATLMQSAVSQLAYSFDNLFKGQRGWENNG